MSGKRRNGTSSGQRAEAHRAATERARAESLAAACLAIERTTADLHGLAELARSAALPPARRVDELERAALKHLSDLRESLAARHADDEPLRSPLPTIQPRAAEPAPLDDRPEGEIAV
jgi:hypothetical protein